jgi:hypothetical protein
MGTNRRARRAAVAPDSQIDSTAPRRSVHRAPDRGGPLKRRSASSDRRVFLLALLASAGLHALLLLVRFESDLSQARAASAAPARRDVAVLRVYAIEPVASGTPPAALPPAPSAAVEEPMQPASTSTGTIATGTTDPDPGLADRTTPRFSDPRLWRVPTLRLPEPTELERARVPMAERMDQLNDSIAAEDAAERENADWTLTDRSGAHWGVSPSTIHLGRTELRLQFCTAGPCPDLFVPPPGRTEEFVNRVRGFEEIRQQVARAGIAEILRQRAAAVRQRRDTTGGGTL